MANIMEMVGTFIMDQTDYLVTIPDFSNTMGTSVYVVKQTPVPGETYFETSVALLSNSFYTYVNVGSNWNIRFNVDVVNANIAFTVRQNYLVPTSSWADLSSDSQIHYQVLNKQNTDVYLDLQQEYDYSQVRNFILETAYKWEEMLILPYLDEEHIWLKRGNKMIEIHRTDLIKEQYDEILQILATVRAIQADVTDKYNQIIILWGQIQATATQIQQWKGDIETLYLACLQLKVDMQTLYTNFNTMASGYVTQITNLSNSALAQITTALTTGLADIAAKIAAGELGIISLTNDSKTEINNSKNISLVAIEDAKDAAIQAILDAAAEIIGRDFLLRGGTSYNNAKEIEEDIDALKSRPSSTPVLRMKIFLETVTDGSVYKLYDSTGITEMEVDLSSPFLVVCMDSNLYPPSISLKDNTLYPLYREMHVNSPSPATRTLLTQELTSLTSYEVFYDTLMVVRTGLLSASDAPGIDVKNSSGSGGESLNAKFNIQYLSGIRYIQMTDLDNNVIDPFDQSKTYTGRIDLTNLNTNFSTRDPLLRSGGEFIYPSRYSYDTLLAGRTAMKYSYFRDKSVITLFFDNTTSTWIFENNNLIFSPDSPGMQDTKASAFSQSTRVPVGFGFSSTSVSIIDKLNSAWTSGNEASITNFFSASDIVTPKLDIFPTGYMTFDITTTVDNRTVICTYYPEKVLGYGNSINKMEIRIPYNISNTGVYKMNYDIDPKIITNWKIYGGKQNIFSGTASTTINYKANTSIVASTFGTTIPVMLFKKIIISGNIVTSRAYQMTSLTTTFSQEAFINNVNTSLNEGWYSLVRYPTNVLTTWEEIRMRITPNTVVAATLIDVFLGSRADGTGTPTGTVTLNITRIDGEFF